MFQTEKRLVLDYYQAMATAPDARLLDVMQPMVADDYLWRGYHPFHEQHSLADVVDVFWLPLRRAFSYLQRRQDIFMAGNNRLATSDGGVWVVSMGHLMGLFEAPWLGIAPTGKMAFLRYCEFNKVVDGNIGETALFFDIPHVMMQAGLTPFPPMTGAQLVQPGPMTHQGLLWDEQPPAAGHATMAAIDRMVADVKTWQQAISLEDELRRSWHEDMIWWGPTGIGASYTIAGYARQHAGPFRQGFVDRVFNGHICRMAEGALGGFFGWPNLTLQPSGGFMGMPATGKAGDMRVIDIYRRDGDKLAENWVFIDLLHFWNQQGVDILGRMQTVPRT